MESRESETISRKLSVLDRNVPQPRIAEKSFPLGEESGRGTGVGDAPRAVTSKSLLYLRAFDRHSFKSRFGLSKQQRRRPCNMPPTKAPTRARPEKTASPKSLPPRANSRFVNTFRSAHFRRLTSRLFLIPAVSDEYQ